MLFFNSRILLHYKVHEALIEEQGQLVTTILAEAVSITITASIKSVTLASFLSPKVSSRQIIMARTAKVHQEMKEVVAVALTIWHLHQRPL